MKKTLAAILLLLLTSTLFAKEGTGTRGGGYVIDVNGTPRLFDIVSNETCRWVTGEDLLTLENLKLQEALDKISEVDWYFAHELSLELRYLKYCFTGDLFKLPLEPDPIIKEDIRNFFKLNQAGIRYLSKVFISKKIFQELNYPWDRELFIIHEVMHSYLSYNWDVPTRRIRLESMVATIGKVLRGELKSRKDFHFQMESNDIKFPRTVDNFDQYKEQIIYLTETRSVKEKMLLNSNSPESLINLPIENLKKYLAPWDQEIVSNYVFNSLIEDLSFVMINGSISDFKNIVTKEYKKINPVFLAFSNYNWLSSSKFQFVLESNQLQNNILSSIKSIENQKLTFTDFRIKANAEIQTLGFEIPKNELVNFTSLKPKATKYRLENSSLLYPWAGMAKVVHYLAKEKRWDLLTSLFIENPYFRKVYHLEHLNEQIMTSSTYFSGEKVLALNVLNELKSGMHIQFWNEIVQGIDEQTLNELQSKWKELNI